MQGTTPAPSYAVTPPLWYVHSCTNRTLYHAVTLDLATGLYRCDCPDHWHRRRDCWHIRAVQAGIVKPATRKPAPVTAAPAPEGNPSAWLWDPEA